MSKTCAIVPAAGRGLRMGAAKPKQFLEISGKPLLLHTLETLSGAHFLAEILLVVPLEFLPTAENLLGQRGLHDTERGECYRQPPFGGGRLREQDGKPDEGSSADHRLGAGGQLVRVIAGGAERQDSVFNGLQALPSDCDWVFVHDGVRPFASLELLHNTWHAACQTGAAIAALPASDTVKRVCNGQVVETLPRDEIWLVQTPQVFRREILLEAYREARRQGWAGTDDAFLVERLGVPIAVVPGERSNIKVTTPEDLAWGRWFLAQARSGRKPAGYSGEE